MRSKLPIYISVLLLLMATTAFAQAPGRGPGGPRGGRGIAPGGRQGRGGSERLLDGLPLSNAQQGNQARAALAAYDQTLRIQTLEARSVLLEKMRAILTEDQLSQFKDDLDQVPLLPPPPPQPRGVATADLVSRLAAFDINQDGKVTKDELPERMLNLLNEGDANHDGALDKTEISNLAARAAVNDQPPGRGGGGGRGGRGGRGGPPPGRGFGPGGFAPASPPDQQ